MDANIVGVSTPIAMRENGPQVCTALEDVIKLGHVYFPQLSLNIF
jgi:hypothetical protein